MKIENNRMVSIIYDLHENDHNGRIIESVNPEKPFNFIFGTGRLLPLFESNLDSLSAGDPFSFRLDSSDAYGEKREEMIIDVPVAVFQTDGKIDENICRVGNSVPMTDESGNSFTGVINEISKNHVRMDFNHPMAGVNLYFSGKIVDVREATDEEMDGYVHSCSSCGSHSKNSCAGSCS